MYVLTNFSFYGVKDALQIHFLKNTWLIFGQNFKTSLTMKKQLRTRNAFVTNQQSFLGFFYILIVITFCLPSFLGQESRKEPFRSLNQAATVLFVNYARWRLRTLPLKINQDSCEYQFFSIWSDPTRNQTLVYPFSGKCSIHSTSDRTTTIAIGDLPNKNHAP